MGKKLAGCMGHLAGVMLSRRNNVILLSIALFSLALGEISKAADIQVDIFRGWWFSACISLLILNSFLCSLRRFWMIYKEKAIGHKSRIGRWGSLIFHISLGVLGLGILINDLFGMSGAMAIPVGHPVYEEHSFYLGRVKEGKLFDENHARFKLYLERLSPEYEYGNKTFSSLKGQVTIEEGGYRALTSSAGPNQIINHRGRKIMLGNFGVAPLISVHFDNKERLRTFVTLARGGGVQGQSLYFADSIAIPQTPVVAHIRVYPDSTYSGGQVSSRSLLLKNPVMELELKEDGFLLKKDLLEPGESLTLDNGLTVCFEDIEYYGFFTISYLPGLWIFYLGLLGIVLGLSLTVMFDYHFAGRLLTNNAKL